jgi:hypothetical protein
MTKRLLTVEAARDDDYLERLPTDVWVAILLQCGITTSLLHCVSKKWHTLAQCNADQLLREWLAREAAKPIIVPCSNRFFLAGRDLCWTMRDMAPNWAMYRAAMRLTNLDMALFEAFVPTEDVPLHQVLLVHYIEADHTYYVLPLRHYKQLLQTLFGGVPSKQSMVKKVMLRSTTTEECNVKTVQLPVFAVVYDAPVVQGSLAHRILSEHVLRRKQREGEATFVSVPADWDMQRALDYLNRSLEMAALTKEARSRVTHLRDSYYNQAVAEWYSQCDVECDAMRERGEPETLCSLVKSGMRAVRICDGCITGYVPSQFRQIVPYNLVRLCAAKMSHDALLDARPAGPATLDISPLVFTDSTADLEHAADMWREFARHREYFTTLRASEQLINSPV